MGSTIRTKQNKEFYLLIYFDIEVIPEKLMLAHLTTWKMCANVDIFYITLGIFFRKPFLNFCRGGWPF